MVPQRRALKPKFKAGTLSNPVNLSDKAGLVPKLAFPDD
jgi:hypothetical protein